MRILPRLTHALLALALLLVLGGCGPSRPDFSVDQAHVDVAAAFNRPVSAVAVYGDNRVPNSDPPTWMIDFKIDGFAPFLQAKFVAGAGKWDLRAVRERPAGSKETPWMDVGTMLAQSVGATRENAATTQDTIRTLAAWIDRYAVEHGNKYPNGSLSQIHDMVVQAGYATPAQWHHDSDGWGNALYYHAAPDGQSYIVISAGADGSLDIPAETYYSNTDAGFEAYAGRNHEPNRDIVWATGAFVQYYEP